MGKLSKGLTLLFLFFLLLSGRAYTQIKSAPISIDKKQMTWALDSLRKNFGINKKIPAKYELSLLAALSYYPELKNVRIKVTERKAGHTMETRPSVWSVFRKKSKRKHIISINTSLKDSIPLFDDFTFNAQVGIMGHELAHICEYIHTGTFALCKMGCKYRKLDYREKMEKNTDLVTIQHGLGWQSYDFANAVLNVLPVGKKYKAYKEKIYYTPRQIYDQMSILGYDL
jgi:hypothetical protein